MALLDSPVPIITGINKSSSYILENEYHIEHKDSIFVDLDTNKIICENRALIKSVNSNSPYFKDFFGKIKTKYENLSLNHEHSDN